MPALAPASIDILQTVIRPSIDNFFIASPEYSMTWPVPPAVPILPIIASTKSFAETPLWSSPSISISIFLAGFWIKVCVAKTCSTSDVPIPKARAPKAPCVAVWLSPQTIVIPGCVKPCSGPMTWTIPCLSSIILKYGIPKSFTFWSKASTWILDSSSSIPEALSVVGTLWSATANVLFGEFTVLPDILKPSKAWGLVTSWTKCLSIYIRDAPSSWVFIRW